MLTAKRTVWTDDELVSQAFTATVGCETNDERIALLKAHLETEAFELLKESASRLREQISPETEGFRNLYVTPNASAYETAGEYVPRSFFQALLREA